MAFINDNSDVAKLLEKLADIKDTVSTPRKAATKQVIREIVHKIKASEAREITVLVNPEVEPEYFNQFITEILNPTPKIRRLSK